MTVTFTDLSTRVSSSKKSLPKDNLNLQIANLAFGNNECDSDEFFPAEESKKDITGIKSQNTRNNELMKAMKLLLMALLQLLGIKDKSSINAEEQPIHNAKNSSKQRQSNCNEDDNARKLIVKALLNLLKIIGNEPQDASNNIVAKDQTENPLHSGTANDPREILTV